ncbi:MAG: Plug domain-containing protein [Gemmatimonadota bacterium]|nr:Plug domain-containing protein [Gemmatimonadota bacterium]
MRRRSSLLLFIFAASVVGCVSASRKSLGQSASTQTISAEEIASSGFNNAWDLLRARARRYDFYEDRYGRPRGIKTRRGRSTINVADSDTPMILVDGARVSDFGALRDLTTDAIYSIELLNGISGTVSQGTNAAAGVIYIHTWEASGG